MISKRKSKKLLNKYVQGVPMNPKEIKSFLKLFKTPYYKRRIFYTKADEKLPRGCEKRPMALATMNLRAFTIASVLAAQAVDEFARAVTKATTKNPPKFATGGILTPAPLGLVPWQESHMPLQTLEAQLPRRTPLEQRYMQATNPTTNTQADLDRFKDFTRGPLGTPYTPPRTIELKDGSRLHVGDRSPLEVTPPYLQMKDTISLLPGTAMHMRVKGDSQWHDMPPLQAGENISIKNPDTTINLSLEDEAADNIANALIDRIEGKEGFFKDGEKLDENRISHPVNYEKDFGKGEQTNAENTIIWGETE